MTLHVVAGPIAIGVVVIIGAGAHHAPPSAVAQRTPGGQPDLSGVWRVTSGKYPANLAADRRDVAFQPAAAALFAERRRGGPRYSPAERCLARGVPGALLVRDRPWKLVQTPNVVVMLFDEFLHYRQIHTDGRGLPQDPNPAWFGYSVAKWQDGTLVVETVGFNAESWLDDAGHPHSEEMRLIERFLRSTVGSMDLEFTIDDPKVYSKPWGARVRFELVPESTLSEHVCPIKPLP